MKRFITLLIGLILLYTTFAYTGVSADNPVIVKVGIYENQPKIFTDDEGNAAGFWPDIINYIAVKEGWEIEYMHGTWTQCLERLEKNEIDMMPDVAYTEDRDKIYDFSQETVYVSWSRVYAKEEADIESVLSLEGKSVAVLVGSVNYEGPDGIKKLTEVFSINCTFIPVDSYLKVFELIDNKKVDAGVVSKDFAYLHLTEFNVIETAIIFQPALLYFAFPPESSLKPYLIERIDENIRQLKGDANSIYYQSLNKWFGAKPIEKPVIPDWVNWMLIGIGILVVLLGGGTYLLRIQVRKKTKELAEDIAQRKKTEKELRESEETLRLILETIPQALVVFDMEGKIVQLNRAALQTGGYNREELIGRKYLDFFAEQDHARAEENLKKTFEIGFNQDNEYNMLRRDGSEFPAKIYTALIKDSSGNPRWMVAIAEDITIQKQAEEEHRKVVEYRELDKLRTNLLSTVSHELRTPLAGIKGYVTLLLDYYNRLKKTQKWESLEAIDSSADRLTELIEHLLDMSRLDTGLLRLNLEIVKPGDILSAAALEAKLRSPKHKFNLQIKPRLPELTADAKRLRQIIDNLLDNAIKYSNEGAEITVQADATQDELQVSIADQGMGIPENEIKKIFDRFYRVEERMAKNPSGLGLGLSLCKALVEALGGRIWVESQEGQGSTFYFTIPLKKQGAKPK